MQVCSADHDRPCEMAGIHERLRTQGPLLLLPPSYSSIKAVHQSALSRPMDAPGLPPVTHETGRTTDPEYPSS